MKLLILMSLIFSGCATRKPRIVKKVKKPDTWSVKKRKCHAYYLNNFGLSVEEAMKICREELERGRK